MRKNFFVSFGFLSTLFIVSCGGGGGITGSGSDIKGFYSLSLTLDNTITTNISPAVDDTSSPISFPPDTIAGQLTLSYNGPNSKNPLYGVIENSEICFGDPTNKCFPANISGTLIPGQPLSFTQQFVQYKYEPPWIILNPYEDEKFPYPSIGQNMTKVTIGTGDGNNTIFKRTLPSNTKDTDGGYITYGDEINVYNNGSFACSLSNAGSCTVTKSGQDVTVTFGTAPALSSNIELEYSAYKSYNFNPNIDAKALKHLYNGQTTAIVNATLKVRVRIMDGTHLDAVQSFQLQVIPKKQK
ncbi:MAG: hypothetical protein ACP5PT_07505 [Brevinematia bacterium]